MPNRTSTSGSELSIVDNSDEDWNVLRYLRDWCQIPKSIDIAHYHKIVVALHETIRLMAETDKVIDAHGGWPGAFATKKD